PILRAHSVPILRDFAGHPPRIRKRRDNVAHQLRLADTPRMPAHHNQPPPQPFTHRFSRRVRFPKRTFGLVYVANPSTSRPALDESRISSFEFHAFEFRFSSFAIRSANSGNRAHHAYASLNLLISRAGVPHTI